MTTTTIAQIIFYSPPSPGSRCADVTLLLSTERYSLCPCSGTAKKKVASYLCHRSQSGQRLRAESMFHAELSSRQGGRGIRPDDAFCQQEAIFHNTGKLEDRKL